VFFFVFFFLVSSLNTTKAKKLLSPTNNMLLSAKAMASSAPDAKPDEIVAKRIAFLQQYIQHAREDCAAMRVQMEEYKAKIHELNKMVDELLELESSSKEELETLTLGNV